MTGHLVHGQNTVDGRNEMMSSFMNTFKSKNEQTLDLDADFLCDYNFIFGDLNYRMDSTFSEMIYDIAKAHTMLSSHDQLTRCMADLEPSEIND